MGHVGCMFLFEEPSPSHDVVLYGMPNIIPACELIVSVVEGAVRALGRMVLVAVVVSFCVSMVA